MASLVLGPCINVKTFCTAAQQSPVLTYKFYFHTKKNLKTWTSKEICDNSSNTT